MMIAIVSLSPDNPDDPPDALLRKIRLTDQRAPASSAPSSVPAFVKPSKLSE
jgi:hypothetical protein